MHEIPELGQKGLRNFGLTTGAIVAALFGILFPWFLGLPFPRWPWIFGGVLMGWGLIGPGSLRPVYRLWMKFGLVMSRIMTPLVLGILFFIIVTPVSLVLRLRGRDSLARKIDKGITSYRMSCNTPPVKDLEKPF